MQLQENTDAYRWCLLCYEKYKLGNSKPMSFKEYCKELAITIESTKQRKTYYESTKDD